jgi:hypothetical protein
MEIVQRGQKVYLTHTWAQEKSKLVHLVGSLLASHEQAAAISQT